MGSKQGDSGNNQNQRKIQTDSKSSAIDVNALLSVQPNLYESILNNLPSVAMMIQTQSHEIVFSNKSGIEIGATPGKKCHEILAQRDEACPDCQVKEAWPSGETHRHSTCIKKKNWDTYITAVSDKYHLYYAYDNSHRTQTEKKLLSEVTGFSAKTGEEYFESIVKHIAESLNVRYVLIGELMESVLERVKTATVYAGGEIIENIEYDLAGTPCHEVIGKTLCCFQRDIQSLFPKDLMLVDMDAESYIGIPLFSQKGEPIGIMAVVDDKPLLDEDVVRAKLLFSIFASRVEAELDRLKTETALKESEIRYRNLVETSHDLIWMCDEKGHFTYLNSAWEDVLDYKVEDMLGHHFTEFKPQEKIKQNKLIFKKVLEGIDIFGGETEYLSKSGEIKHLIFNARQVLDKNGKVIGTQGTFFDLTAHKKSSEALQVSQQTAADIIRNIPTGLFLYEFESPDRLVLIDANLEAIQLTEVTLEEWRGKELNEIWPMAKSTGFSEICLNVIKTGETYKTEDFYYKDERLDRSYRISAFQIPGDRLAVAFDDITNNKENELKLESINKELMKERVALQNKNVALNELIEQIEDQKKQARHNIQSNVNRIILPTLKSLRNKLDSADIGSIDLLEKNLSEITSPFIDKLDELYSKLTQREIEVCNMVRNGMSSKEIAEILNISVNTVHNQRRRIRKKMGIADNKTNIVSFLKSL